ncbi:Hypothetical predicted protein [Scomber scombrus]|uniref:Uncharacterized protein n=1 Tax=Scomber scombrus TaxID=13677 RepID=A0AAV1MYI7_SCOSC
MNLNERVERPRCADKEGEREESGGGLSCPPVPSPPPISPDLRISSLDYNGYTRDRREILD